MNPKKVSVLVDGGFLNKKNHSCRNPEEQANRIETVAKACVDDDEELYRIFYYDCQPFAGKSTDPGGNEVDFRMSSVYTYQRSLIAHLEKRPFLAVRLGELSFRGWKLKPQTLQQIIRTKESPISLSPSDFMPDFQQKGVDMRIGLDVALLAIDGLVDRVVLVTADSDFIPAMKLARREGLQVALVSLSNAAKPTLLAHADIYRNPPVVAEIVASAKIRKSKMLGRT